MMSNVSHTPGPWRVSHHFSTVDGRQIECDPDPGMFDACIMTTNSDGRLIAIAGERGSKLNPYDYLPVAESVANMRLIAAAPDLLAIAEKLDALQRQFEFYSMGNKMPGNELYSLRVRLDALHWQLLNELCQTHDRETPDMVRKLIRDEHARIGKGEKQNGK